MLLAAYIVWVLLIVASLLLAVLGVMRKGAGSASIAAGLALLLGALLMWGFVHATALALAGHDAGTVLMYALMGALGVVFFVWGALQVRPLPPTGPGAGRPSTERPVE